MKFLILVAALVAVASAQQFNDGVFQFGDLKKAVSLSSSPVYSSFVAQPTIKTEIPVVAKTAVPVLVKSIEQEIPFTTAYNQQYKFAQPSVYSQYNQQYKFAQPSVYSQYKFTQPSVYSQYNQQYKFAQPSVYSQYNQQFAQPSVYSQYNQYNQQYKFAQPSVYSQYNQQFAQPSVYYTAKPAVRNFAQDSLSTYASAYNGPQWRILSQTQEAEPSGNYKVSYATENGIQSSEEGVLVNGSEGPVIAARGAYSYTGPDNVEYTVTWVADENGYRASGAHLPQPPAIPEEIQRSLVLNSAEKYDDQGRLILKKK